MHNHMVHILMNIFIGIKSTFYFIETSSIQIFHMRKHVIGLKFQDIRIILFQDRGTLSLYNN